jgi:hypothetical protein
MSRGINNPSYPVGIGYVCIPFDADRKKYVSTCFRKERVAIQLDDGGTVIKNCYISKSLLSEVVFPEVFDKLGSAVSFIVPTNHDIPIIVGVISRPGDNQLLDEHEYQKIISSDMGVVSLTMKPDGGIFLDVDSDFENKGNFKVTLRSKNNTAKFDVSCFGDINLYSEGKVSLEALKSCQIRLTEVLQGIKQNQAQIMMSEEGFTYEDKFKNKITCDIKGKITLHEGTSPAVKGDELAKQLVLMKSTIDSFIDIYLQTISTVGAGGPAAKTIMEVGMALVRKEDFSSINSKHLLIK